MTAPRAGASRSLADLDPVEALRAAWAGLDPQRRGLLARAGWAAALVASLVGIAATGLSLEHGWRALRRAEAEAARPLPRLAASPAAPSQPQGDFVQELPGTAPSDAQIRHAARLAESLHLVVVQMQAEAQARERHVLGRVRLTVQLRGDYRDVKAFVAGMLGKYDGLVLERFSIARSSSAGADEAHVELVQYERPRAQP